MAYPKGKKRSPETRKKISAAMLRAWQGVDRTGVSAMERNKKIGLANLGEKHGMWRGNKVKYRALHTWIQNRLGKPDQCKNCRKAGLSARQIHWANISGQYKRDELDWIRLCMSCHRYFDDKNIKQYILRRKLYAQV